MDEKVREIEESLEEKYLLWYEEGKYLLSRIKKLEDVQEFTTKNIFFLQEELDKARARIKELEADCQGYKNGQLQVQSILDSVMDSNTQLGKRVMELEAILVEKNTHLKSYLENR